MKYSTMSKRSLLVPAFALSLAGSTAWAQAPNPALGDLVLLAQRGQQPPPAPVLGGVVFQPQTETQVQEQLQQMQALLQRIQQMPPDTPQTDRVSSLRELERALAKLQESEQRRRVLLNPNGNQAALQSAAQALQQAAQGVRGGQRSGGNVAIAPVTVAPNQGRMIIRQNTLGGGLNVLVGGGAWWMDANLTARLGLTEDQKTRIDRAFTNHRTNLEANRNNLEREETQLATLLDAEPLDRNAVTSQVARVTNARGEVERVNAAMLLEMREQMTRAQWNQLQAIAPRATVMVDVPVTPGTATPFGIAPATPGGIINTPFGPQPVPGTRGGGGRGARGQ